MKQRKFLTLFAALFFVMMPAVAVFTGMDLDATLSNLRRELYHDYLLISETREQMGSKYEVQHQKMVSIVKRCNDLSLMLYSQKQDYTFDVSYALERVMQEYDEFNANRTPYDRIVSSLDVEINRYARLIESLRRLPPELRDVEVVPDSLAYHNDTLDAHLMANESLLQQELNAQLDSLLAVAVVSAEHPSAFILSEAGQADRDSCLLYASELLKLYAETRELVMTDSTHYREAQLRMAESYNYARDYSALLQDKVFKEGQTPWKTILAHPGEYWKEAWRAMAEKYNFSSFMKKLAEKEQIDRNGEIAKDNQLTNSARIYWLFVYCLAFFVLWGLSYLLLLPLYRYVKPLGNQVAKEQKLFLALLLACVLFITLSNESMQDDIARKSISITHTFIWLLLAINTALLVRLDPVKLKYSVRIYLPTIFTALVVISCRVLFMPNAFLNVILTPLLLAMALWQLLVNLRHSGKTDKTDVAIAWASFGVTAISLIIACRGFIFLALIVLAWWYFQLALILAIASIWDLTQLYKKKRLDRRISTQKAKITYVAGATKDNLMFGATWFYDLIREVAIPLLVIGSIPICVYWALNIFEFNDLYRALFQEPFYTQGGFQASIYSLLFLGAVFVVFRYANKAIHALWQTFKYRRFMRKNNRKTVRGNEINLALGNSLISVFVWFVYRLAGARRRRSVGRCRSGPQGYPEQLHLRHPAHGRPPAGRRLDRLRRHPGQGGRHQLPDHPGGNALRHPGRLPERFPLWQELHQPDP